MIKVGIQTYKNTGHQGRGIGVYGSELVNHLKLLDSLEVVEFSHVSEVAGKVDLIHYLHFDLFQKTLVSRLNTPFVVTVHDVTPLVFPGNYPSGIKGKIRLFWQKNSLKKANRVITISEASKKDIVKYLGINAEKIDVVYSGVGKHFRKIRDEKVLNRVADKYNLAKKFAFYSGNVNWNKNILNMTQACIDADLDLVIVGKSFSERGDLDHPELKSFKEFLHKYENNSRVHILGYVEDEDMVGILNQASVALFTSYYEGFGFPILEAQACEVPVITSKVSSMPEISGDGAYFVDPYNAEEIMKGIKEVVGDKKLRQDLTSRGNENVKKFSWERCARETAEIYHKILE